MASSQAPQSHPADEDPVSKFKILIPHLKEALTNLMKISAFVFHQNAHIDGCVKITEASPLRLEKALEDFYAICDQIELNLRLALESHSQNADSFRNAPYPVQGGSKGEPEPRPDTQTYSQYLSTVKTQVACAKEVHDALIDCARKLGAAN